MGLWRKGGGEGHPKSPPSPPPEKQFPSANRRVRWVEEKKRLGEGEEMICFYELCLSCGLISPWSECKLRNFQSSSFQKQSSSSSNGTHSSEWVVVLCDGWLESAPASWMSNSMSAYWQKFTIYWPGITKMTRPDVKKQKVQSGCFTVKLICRMTFV